MAYTVSRIPYQSQRMRVTIVYALASRQVESSADLFKALKTMRQNFIRRITTETQKLRRKETEGEDTDER